MSEGAIVWAPDVPLPDRENLRLPDRITHLVLYRADAEYNFIHESTIARHNGSFFVAWNNSHVIESERGTVVRWIRSNDDFLHWSPPVALARPLTEDSMTWESCQLCSIDGSLWAFLGQAHVAPRTAEVTGGSMAVFCFDESTEEWHLRGTVPGFHPQDRPKLSGGGNWVMGGKYNLVLPRVAISRGNDPTAWDVVEIPSGPEHNIDHAETSLAVGSDTVTAYVRTSGEKLLVSKSSDNGRTWSPLIESNLPASSSKTCAGTLSTGRSYLAFNMRDRDGRQGEWGGSGSRDVLVVAVSAPGEQLFRRIVRIRSGTPPPLRFERCRKGRQWSYPSVEEYGGNVYITYSVTKEGCCLSVIPLSEFG